MLVVWERIDRVVVNGRKRDRSRLLRRGDGTVGLAEHARQDAVADRGLEEAAVLALAAFEVAVDRAEGFAFVLVAPELDQRRVVGLELRLEALDRE